MRKLAAALLAILIAVPAMARPPAHHGGRSAVSVQINPWSPSWRPAPRSGYVWVDGYWDVDQWIPGYWAPTYSRAGYVWVRGYYDGVSYTDGYWRSTYRAGHSWVSGRWNGRSYSSGYWAPSHRVATRSAPHSRAATPRRAGHSAARPASRSRVPSSSSRPAARPGNRSSSSRGGRR